MNMLEKSSKFKKSTQIIYRHGIFAVEVVWRESQFFKNTFLDPHLKIAGFKQYKIK